MKRIISLILAAMMLVSMLAACGASQPDPTDTTVAPTSAPDTTPVEAPTEAAVDPMALSTEEKLAYAATLSNEELYELAKKEKGTLSVYTVTSLCETAMANFLAKYPDLAGVCSTLGEAEVLTKLTTEVGTAAEGADMALIQNAYRVENELLSEGLMLNYFPDMYKDSVPEVYQDPCVILFAHKNFIFNSTGGDIGLHNVWQLTEEAYADKIFFKDPTNEAVGMNFLVMLTGEEWSGKLADAYKAYYGKEWSKDSGFENAGYEFLDGFLKNCNYTYAADGGIAEGVSTGAAGNVGLFVFSKLRSASVVKENITLAAFAANEGKGLTGFSGFMYATYAQICKDTDMPYSCCLFINYLFSEEGFSAWNNENSMGVYSPNTDIALVPDFTGLDREITYWLDVVVVEDGVVVAEKYPEAYEFIATRLS